MKKCQLPGCDNHLSKYGKKFCSVECGRVNATRISVKNKKSKDYTITCAQCGKVFDRRGDPRRKFCSRSCSATYNNQRDKSGRYVKKYLIVEPPPRRICLGCMKKRPYKSGKTWCSAECKYLHLVNLWINGMTGGNGAYTIRAFVRRYVYERAGYVCEATDSRTGERCTESRTHPKTGKTVLQVDHIDGNWQNSTPENLRAVCPTCHALTDTYAGHNRGRGRTWKAEYQQYQSKE